MQKFSVEHILFGWALGLEWVENNPFFFFLVGTFAFFPYCFLYCGVSLIILMFLHTWLKTNHRVSSKESFTMSLASYSL